VIAGAWGAIGIFVRWAALPAVVIVAVRCWFASLTIGLAGLARQGRAGARRAWHVPKPWAVLALGLGLAFHWVCLVGAQQRAPLGTVLLLVYLSPVLVALLAPRVLGEHVPARTFVALGVALVGTLLLVRPERGEGLGVALALVAGVSYAAITLGSKWAVGDVGGVRLAFVQLTVAGLTLAPLAVTADWGQPSWSWAWLVLLGVVFTGVLGPLYLVLLNHLPASTVGVLGYVEPASAVVLAWLVLGERPAAATLVGGTLIVAAGIMVVLTTRDPLPPTVAEQGRTTRASR
jgi:drug/metabolite transporter (DMT)-like permease